MVSTGPPAAYGTTTVTGRLGHSCARGAVEDASASASAAVTIVLFMVAVRGSAGLVNRR